MKAITRRSSYWIVGAGVGLAALSIFFTFVPNLSAQDGPTPRLADGHPDLSGRYLLNAGNPPQQNPVFKPETKAKYQFANPKGACVRGGTPTSITRQATDHNPVQLVSRPGVLWILTESPQSIRWVPTDGRPHSKDPDTSYAGESFGHWDGDTLVVDTVGIDKRMRNLDVGAPGDANSWTHSDQEHVIERFSRPTKNSLTYQLTVEDPIVLTKQFASSLMRWSLAQGPDTWKPRVPSETCDF